MKRSNFHFGLDNDHSFVEFVTLEPAKILAAMSLFGGPPITKFLSMTHSLSLSHTHKSKQ